MKPKLTIILIVGLSALAGCLSTPMNSILFNGTEQFVDNNTGLASGPGSYSPIPIGAGTRLGPGRVAKRGEGCVSSFFPLNLIMTLGGEGMEEAMANAGITRVAVVDRRTTTVLLGLLYFKECVVVWGE